MPMMDVFSSNIFSAETLTAAVNANPHQPGRLGALGLFEEKGVATTKVMIERRDGKLVLLQARPRGAPVPVYQRGRSEMLEFKVPFTPLEETIYAHSFQDRRVFGTESELMTAQIVVAESLTGMQRSHAATLEYHRVGAIKGLILDADGSTIYDLFTEFGVAQQTQSFALADGSTQVRTVCMATRRKIEDALGDESYMQLRGFAGKDFFDKLISHPDVMTAYENYAQGEYLRNDPKSGFRFGDILWEEYRGKVNGTDYIAADQAYVVPEGVPGLFITRFAPADFVDAANTLGLPLYARPAFDTEFMRWVKIMTQQSALNLCTRPRAVIKCTVS
ncbi:major capsid protein E [Plasticicumulans lactativorans]|uniref:Major capsid protein E n=1 Tax=Plasticicumulans lactativorans TaxID=1133106 RepID=A0A4R2LC20_9GAMM|nr:major capsid protein [Plasticicumulans lactativorans]TCO83074.1 major capsid protein E [Plasticicumulans lactativorans]